MNIYHRFSEKLECVQPEGCLRVLDGDKFRCSVCGNVKAFDKDIFRAIDSHEAVNPLEKVNYDDLHNVKAKASNRLAARYLDLAGRADDTELEVLEIGCETGRLTMGLACHQSVALTVGVDISMAFLRATKRKISMQKGSEGRLVLLCADVNKMPFRYDTFDIVAGNLFLHHVYDYDTFLKHLRRLLRPGGAVLFNEPCQQGKSLVSFVLSLIVEHDLRAQTPVLTEEERQRLRDTAHVMMREKFTAAKPEMKQQMEDKHIFDTRALARTAKKAGFTGFEHYDAPSC